MRDINRERRRQMNKLYLLAAMAAALAFASYGAKRGASSAEGCAKTLGEGAVIDKRSGACACDMSKYDKVGNKCAPLGQQDLDCVRDHGEYSRFTAKRGCGCTGGRKMNGAGICDS
jgi:hypothetical protein